MCKEIKNIKWTGLESNWIKQVIRGWSLIERTVTYYRPLTEVRNFSGTWRSNSILRASAPGMRTCPFSVMSSVYGWLLSCTIGCGGALQKLMLDKIDNKKYITILITKFQNITFIHTVCPKKRSFSYFQP